MAAVAGNGAGVNVPSQDLNGPQVAQSMNFMQKYGEERDKRIKEEGLRQYIDLRQSEKYKKFIQDPWIDSTTHCNAPVSDGGHCKVLIVGAGFGGILFAVRLLHAGFQPEDLLIVDPAGGFGGTWYWNRYPGLMCDVESYVYLPLLEEMGYVPKRKYASGVEIREYAESICSKYGLHRRAMFQSYVSETTWSESKSQWIVKIAKKPKGGEESQQTVHVNFVCIAPGLLSNAKLPDVNGLANFSRHMFHTARWDYDYTGGTPEDPSLTGLQGKKVALVGTGATAVQATAGLAKYAQQLYIFQRTPSSVDSRDNCNTDPDWFQANVATKKGWQRERALNFCRHIDNVEPKPAQNLVDDRWTNMGTYCALVGTPKPVTMDNVAQHVEGLYALDLPRQVRLHQRVEEVVKNQDAAKALKAWYPSWCKRPCFHDEYLQAFNSPNVSLVDTSGKGIDRVTEKGVEFDGKVYDVDLIVWSTGFRAPGLGSAAGKAEITVTGKDGLNLEKLNDTGDLSTLHGVNSHGFPNMFWAGPLQAGISASFTLTLDAIATHVAYIISETTRTAGDSGTPVVEPRLEAQETWAMQVALGAVTFAALSGCTPSYINKEGEIDRLSMDEKMKAAKLGIWPNGFESYLNVLERWQSEGSMEGLDVQYVK